MPAGPASPQPGGPSGNPPGGRPVPLPSLELLAPAEAEVRQRRAAGWYRAKGLREGDRVAFSLGSSAALLCAVLGASRTGIVPVLLNATLTARERAALVEDADPSVVIEDTTTLAELDRGDPAELADHPLTRPMHYTSGTTGRPKGVSSGIWDEGTAAAAHRDEAALWGFDRSDLHLVCSPMYHSVSIRLAATALLQGSSCLVMSRFEARSVVDTLRRERPTTAFLVPSHLQRIDALGVGDDRRTFSSLRLLIHAGEPCPPNLKRTTMARCGPAVVWEFYGSTEGQFTACSPSEWLERPGTVGRARPGRVLSVDTGPGEEDVGGDRRPGTIWCRAPAFARFTYWRDPEATARAWRGEAFTVGDLGHLDEAGYLFLSGRRHDLVISGGTNVYPAEVEAALAEVPGVHEVAVFGRPDERWGQRVCAAVVAERGVDEAQLRAAAYERLAPYKRPKEYHLVAELPHTATGKLQRARVAAELGLEP